MPSDPHRAHDSGSARGLLWRYALLACVTHLIFITLSLFPGWRADSLLIGDAITYVTPAENLLSHGAFSRESQAPFLWEPYRTPGYSLVIAGSIALFGGYQWALYLAAVTAGVAGGCAVWLTEQWGGNRRAQHFAGILVACLPNSLGLAGMLLTDALVGHLILLWVCLLYHGFTQYSNWSFGASVFVLCGLESLKPTLNLGAALIVPIGFLLSRFRRWKIIVLLGLLSLPLPLFFATMNLRDHGIFAPTLLDMATAREYLHANYLASEAGVDYSTMVTQIRAADRLAAGQLETPPSFYGRLAQVHRNEVWTFLTQQPVQAAWLMLSEALRQFAAPQEFALTVFIGEPAPWLRALGSAITLALWASALFGGWQMGRAGNWQPGLIALGVLAFFLATGSVSHYVGARLRFPADLAAVPLAAIGVSRLLRNEPRLT